MADELDDEGEDDGVDEGDEDGYRTEPDDVVIVLRTDGDALIYLPRGLDMDAELPLNVLLGLTLSEGIDDPAIAVYIKEAMKRTAEIIKERSLAAAAKRAADLKN